MCSCRKGLSFLNCLDGLSNSINDVVYLRVRRDEGRREQVNVSTDAAVQAAFATLLVQSLTHFPRWIKRFLCVFIFDKFKADQHSHTTDVAYVFEHLELLNAVQ